MEVKIYQIGMNKECEYEFAPWSIAKNLFNINDYNLVWSYVDVSKEDIVSYLNEIYRELNINQMNYRKYHGFKGRSMSMSDVVVFDDNKAYYCDMFGWKEIFIG